MSRTEPNQAQSARHPLSTVLISRPVTSDLGLNLVLGLSLSVLGLGVILRGLVQIIIGVITTPA